MKAAVSCWQKSRRSERVGCCIFWQKSRPGCSILLAEKPAIGACRLLEPVGRKAGDLNVPTPRNFSPVLLLLLEHKIQQVLFDQR
jgi:hypothetical protein